jgi:hypothetical protein
MKNYKPESIEELLKGRIKNPIATLKLIKDIARRVKKLEISKRSK